MADRIMRQKSQDVADYATSHDRFRHRFDEMAIEVDSMMARCREATKN
jgi:hypothetical protein